VRNLLWWLIMCLVAVTVLIVGCKKSATDSEEEDLNVLVVSNYAVVNAYIDTNFTKNIDGIKISVKDVAEDTLAEQDLKGFDVVLLFEDGNFGNSQKVGNMIYKYVMAGGNVVIGTFYWQDGWGNLEMIVPLYGESCRYQVDSLGSTIEHSLTKGVNYVRSYYRGGPNTLRENATAVAWWSNEDVFMAFNKPKGTITMVTTYPGENYFYETRGLPPDSVGGDFYRVWNNALKWTARNTIPSQPLGKSTPIQLQGVSRTKAIRENARTGTE
jgi:hypothetical protein